MIKKSSNKSFGWTLIELIMAMIVITLISGTLVSIFKPSTQKARFFLYSTFKNLSAANALILDKMGELYNGTPTAASSNDPYCLQVADIFSVDGAINCKAHDTAGTSGDYLSKPNFKLTNGVTVYGLSRPWIHPYTDADYYYKDIMVDIDGAKGKSIIGIDRFPLRIYDGSVNAGLVMLMNCGTNYKDYKFGNLKSSDSGVSIAGTTKDNLFCGGATAVNRNFLGNEDILTYDIRQAQEDLNELDGADEDTKVQTDLVQAVVSPLEADCKAYGGTGAIPAAYCDSMTDEKYRILQKCVTDEICGEYCKSSSEAKAKKSCPKNDTGNIVYGNDCIDLRKAKNPKNLACFTTIHKPTGGVNVILNSALEETDL